MIRVLDSAGSTLVVWGRQQQQHDVVTGIVAMPTVNCLDDNVTHDVTTAVEWCGMSFGVNHSVGDGVS